MKTRNMILTAFFAGIICVMALLSSVIPILFGPIPLSLAIFGVYVTASSLNWKNGTLAVIVYILIGLVGIPVFSNFGAGVPKLIGPTGGFIIGYIPCALVIGIIVDRLESKKWAYPVAMVLGTIVLYVCGALWFAVSQNVTLVKALAVCVVPFLIFDAAKIVVASVVSPILRKALKKQKA